MAAISADAVDATSLIAFHHFRLARASYPFRYCAVSRTFGKGVLGTLSISRNLHNASQRSLTLKTNRRFLGTVAMTSELCCSCHSLPFCLKVPRDVYRTRIFIIGSKGVSGIRQDRK